MLIVAILFVIGLALGIFLINDESIHQHNIASSITSKITSCDDLHEGGNQVYYEVFYLSDKDVFLKRSSEIYNHIEKIVNECGINP